MSQTNMTPPDEAERERETAEARAELLRIAEAQGIKPFNFDEMLGDPSEGDPEKENVDDFLRLLREWRDTPSSRRIE